MTALRRVEPEPALPRTAFIGAFTYQISDDPRDWKRCAPEINLDDAHWGLTVHHAEIILLSKQMTPTMTRAILLHELMHACIKCAAALCHTGRKTDEEWVTYTAPSLLDTLTRSPGLAEFLFGRSR